LMTKLIGTSSKGEQFRNSSPKGNQPLCKKAQKGLESPTAQSAQLSQ